MDLARRAAPGGGLGESQSGINLRTSRHFPPPHPHQPRRRVYRAELHRIRRVRAGQGAGAAGGLAGAGIDLADVRAARWHAWRLRRALGVPAQDAQAAVCRAAPLDCLAASAAAWPRLRLVDADRAGASCSRRGQAAPPRSPPVIAPLRRLSEPHGRRGPTRRFPTRAGLPHKPGDASCHALLRLAGTLLDHTFSATGAAQFFCLKGVVQAVQPMRPAGPSGNRPGAWRV